MPRHKRTHRPRHKPDLSKNLDYQRRVRAAYAMFDDDDISTERLLAMISDHCGGDVGDVVDALYETRNDP